jgi:glutathione S-transferase
MVILYEHPLSPYAQKVKIALAEKNVPFELRQPNLVAGDTAELASFNPRLEVPALVDGETAVFDSTIILEYIEDRWPDPPLLPASPAERARARMIEDVCDTYYEAINWAVIEIMIFQRAKGDLAASLIARASAQTAGINAYLAGQLGSRPYFHGDSFGWADLSAIIHVHNASVTGNRPPAGSPLATWLSRTRKRPSVSAVLKAASDAIVAAGAQMLPELVETGRIKREYRDHRLEWMLRSGGVDVVLEGMQKGTIRFSQELG